MRYVAFALLIASAAALADDGTTADARSVVTEASALLAKQEGYHSKVGGNYGMGESDIAMSYAAESIIHGDIAWSKEEQMGIQSETFRKGAKLVIKDPTDGEWKDSTEMGGLNVGGLQDPKVVLTLLDKSADTAEFAGEEKIGDTDCRRINLKPKPEILKDFLAAQGIPDLGLDFSKGKIEFQVWVGKEDNLFRKFYLKGELEMAMPEEDPQPGVAPMEPMKVTATVEVNLFSYNKDLDFEIPDKVKALLGL